MKKNKLLIVLIIVTIINLIQSYGTELLQDEAYYWMYSNFMDWGYFDHPPLVAVYIYISDLFFSGELGVRFMSTLLYSVTVYLVWTIIDIPNKQKHLNLFLLTILSTFLFNVYGFITVPDTPFMLFLAIYLIAYKKITNSNNWKNYLLFSISITGLLYSKYTGVLVVGFTILSNISLLKNKKFWLSICGVLILFSPHIIWQYVNDFPSIRYHLFERSNNRVYRYDYTLMHFVNQIAIIGFTFPIVYLAFFKNLKTKDLFQKSLNYIVIGFISFFFIMSFKGPTQAQWTVPISFPLIIITFYFIINNPKKKKLFTRLAITNLIVIGLARILLANEGILPVQLETHGNKQWVQEIKKETQGQKKLFRNSYQNASLYSFYSGDLTTTYNSFDSRKNQFNLWDLQTPLLNKTIIQVDGGKTENDVYIFEKKKKHLLYGVVINHFEPIKDLNYTFEERKLSPGKNTLPTSIQNPYNYDINLNELNTLIVLKNAKNQTIITSNGSYSKNNDSIKKNETITENISFIIPKNIDVKKIDHLDIVLRNNPKMAFQKVN